MRHFTPTIHEIVIDTETTGLDPLNGNRIARLGRLSLLTVPAGQRAPSGAAAWSDRGRAVKHSGNRPSATAAIAAARHC
jgi:hypothetical protein